MNLRPPPDHANVKELKKWCDELYRFLQYPAFHQIRMVPRAQPTDESRGNMYFDDSANAMVTFTSEWTPEAPGGFSMWTEGGDDIAMESGEIIHLE